MVYTWCTIRERCVLNTLNEEHAYFTPNMLLGLNLMRFLCVYLLNHVESYICVSNMNKIVKLTLICLTTKEIRNLS